MLVDRDNISFNLNATEKFSFCLEGMDLVVFLMTWLTLDYHLSLCTSLEEMNNYPITRVIYIYTYTPLMACTTSIQFYK